MASTRDDNSARRIFRQLAYLLCGLMALAAVPHAHAGENEETRWDRGLFVGSGAPGLFSACLDPGAASTYGLREPIELAWNGQDWIESKNHVTTGAWHVRAGTRGALERGGHGFELDPKGTTSDHWFDEWLWWMQSRGLMPAPIKPAPGRGP